MRTKQAGIIWLAALALAAAVGVGLAQDVAAPGEEDVRMVEITLEGRTVSGRVVSDNEEVIKVEPLGAGAIGYRKNSIAGLRYYTMPAAVYDEQVGDFHHDRLWILEDAAAEFAKARQAYRRALGRVTTAEDKARLNSKLEMLEADREEWQKEALRKEELERARQQTELVKLEKDLAREKLADLQRHEQKIRELEGALSRLSEQNRNFAYAIEDLSRQIVDLKDDVDDLERRRDVYITQGIFLDLKRAHQDLTREVRRLADKVEKD